MKLNKYFRRNGSSSRLKSPLRSSSRSDLKSPLSRSQSTELHSDSSSSSAQSSSLGKCSVPKHIQELQDAFRYFDRNGDGKISVTELGCVLRSLGETPSDEDLRLMVKEVDADGDGFVDFQEFVHLNTTMSADAPESNVEELRAAFYVFDTDRNGYISAQELHQVMLNLGEKGLTIEDCNRMIGGVDSDGDGFVNFEEFQKMMNTMC